MKEVGADVSTEQLKEFVWKTLKSGKVSPTVQNQMRMSNSPIFHSGPFI